MSNNDGVSGFITHKKNEVQNISAVTSAVVAHLMASINVTRHRLMDRQTDTDRQAGPNQVSALDVLAVRQRSSSSTEAKAERRERVFPTFGCEMAGGVPRMGLWVPALLCGVLIRGDT